MVMMHRSEVKVKSTQVAEDDIGLPLGETAGVVDRGNILGDAVTDISGRSAACVSSLGSCAGCHSQLRQQLDTLGDRERRKAEYTRMLVHELRAPVTASRSLAAALRYVQPEDSPVNEALGRIERRMDQLLDLVNDILYLNSIKAGQPLGEVVFCDLSAETGIVCESYFEEALAKGLSMEMDLPSSPITVRIARQDYQLILSNLASNAVKYTPEGKVSITLRKEGPWAILDIKDSGIGIPEEELTQVFTEFFRASNARRSRIPGTGLGLAGVRSLVERSGGKLTFDSKESKGSRFMVRLPIRRPKPVLPFVPPKAVGRVPD
jgi:signal transduction histidine kinase